MPELPEVEVTRLSFASRIAGARVLDAHVGKPLRWPFGVGLHGGAPEAVDALTGAVVQAVRRRGKYLLIDTLKNAKPGLLIIHLGMSGSLLFSPRLPAAGKHDHFSLLTSQGELRLNDPRRFGAVIFAYSEADAWPRKLLGGLGVEPLTDDFLPQPFHAACKQRSAPIKQVLLAGDIVVGVGNIYASEALFLAGIRPTLSAAQLSKPRAYKLHHAVRQVLQAALTKGGSTLRDFSSATGEGGYFQLEANVYGREGEPCRVCAQPIKMIRQGQRSTFYCSNCQK
ncbi:bifunctional DNA-formamidopyrimidine glycosylase/DNA-(apurinic or apyrimidinic site) lyase [Variovorax sp. PCZ-1]|uniref:bifunctional DNA-formamidopyrimidine glycosylase/DNA-(apurinic or apyrimidinic site) lyase n=1 Tax=Variovorax sp. PCZ-1 TaxID=2835533 RepID=UPI001BCD8B3F|nr:bifunctional DNA-formamidopyrimidine glycosylase/DNA-(apurinic or apyrimidinic site) lyase [Variovorax sp. PCZ-1]MBS7807841.1 bifunctional DNA-formamidopyrimidine glycosylase/DNA-(apurinic or apyrimidinic site) lyase [Variovorax sp. PCZ-1]